MNENKKIKITLQDWETNCGDGCCHEYGWDITINDETTSIFGNDILELIRVVANSFGCSDSNLEISYLDEEGNEV